MRLKDVCPCKIGIFPDAIMASGMSLICTKGHRIIVSFNYIPEVLRYGKEQQVIGSVFGSETEKNSKPEEKV